MPDNVVIHGKSTTQTVVGDTGKFVDVPVNVASGNLTVAEQGNIAGLRNPSSSSNSYIPTRNEANAIVISSQTAVTIGGGAANDTHLLGIHIHTALTGTCVITGLPDETGGAKSYTIPAGTVGHIPFYGAKNASGALTVTASNVADDDKICVFWRPV